VGILGILNYLILNELEEMNKCITIFFLLKCKHNNRKIFLFRALKFPYILHRLDFKGESQEFGELENGPFEKIAPLIYFPLGRPEKYAPFCPYSQP